MANLKTGDCSTCFADRYVARDVLVLHAAAAPVTTGRVTSGGTSVMLAVHDKGEAQKIWYAVQNALGWSLQLRPVSNAVDSPESVQGIASILKDGATNASIQTLIGGLK